VTHRLAVLEDGQTGRWALVVGAAGDLGSAIARALRSDGWSLLLADHPSRLDHLEVVATAVREDAEPGAGQVVTAAFDVTDAESVSTTLRALVAEHGVPGAVVVSSGVQGPFRPIQEYDVADAARVLQVNVVGTFSVLATVGSILAEAGRSSSVVLLASMAGVSGAPNMSAYSASKAAVIGLARSAAKDLAPQGIRVNSVSPAFIGPGVMWDNQVAAQAAVGSQYYATDPEEVSRQMIEMIPLRRYGTPEEVADVVSWLAGPRSSYVTGQNIEITGGSV
jgi:NAD(P)-dependent dehydrogenase (short-subunit alcohol dehydrogenase family)